MKSHGSTILGVLLFLAAGITAHGQVVINEVLYDPPGSDQGFEKVELKNIGVSPVSLSGWQFCVHLVYVGLPAMTMNPGQIVTVHFRMSGTNDANNIYLPTFPSSFGGTELENATDSISIYDCSAAGCFTSLGANNRMVEYVQWGVTGSSPNQERHNVAADLTRPGGPLWSTSGVRDHAPQSGEGLSIAYDGTNGGGGELTLGTDFFVGNPSIGSDNTCSGDPQCDDGVFCNGAEQCVGDQCQAGSDPCPGQSCNEVSDECVNCLDDTDCDDAVFCTDDTCDSGNCVFTPNNANCADDGLFCNGAEICNAVSGCLSGGFPCAFNESCNEDTDTCDFLSLPVALEPVGAVGPASRSGVPPLVSPVLLTHAGDNSGRLFIVDQSGPIRIIDSGGQLLATPFLDLTGLIPALSAGFDERGVLGLAFHPNYAANGRFFVRYSAPRAGDPSEPCFGTSRGCHSEILSEFAVSIGDPNVADPTETVLFSVDEPEFNHNAGHVDFGPDGFLYFSLGDGGGANDGLHLPSLPHGPDGNGLNPQTALGSMLRIDVDTGSPYAIPLDNPFADGIDGLPEVYAYGFRNPYRFTFDDGVGGSGALYVADVGQALFEEVSIVVNGGNYGWAIREGFQCFDPFDPGTPPAVCASTGLLGEPLLDPVMDYDHATGGISVIGGFVYRGTEYPDLNSRYVFGDFSADFGPTGRLYYFETTGPDAFVRREFSVSPGGTAFIGHYLKGIGEDEDGEVYVLVSDDLAPIGSSGQVLKIVPPAPSADGEGPRYLAITPTPSPEPFAILVTPDCPGSTAKYLGAPGARNIAKLQMDPNCAAFLTSGEWGGTVYATGFEVVPDQTYLVQSDFGSPGTPALSSAVSITTSVHADSDENTTVSLPDLFCVLNTLVDNFSTCSFYQADLDPFDPNGTISLPDLFVILNALQGATYGGPSPCP